MRKLVILILISLSFIACKKDTDENVSSNLNGKWRVYNRVQDYPKSFQDDVISSYGGNHLGDEYLVFSDNNLCSGYENDLDCNNIEIGKTNITFIKYNTTWTYRFSADTLIVTIQNEESRFLKQ